MTIRLTMTAAMLAVAGFALMPSAASAASLLNGSFELGDYAGAVAAAGGDAHQPGLAPGSSYLSDWDIAGPAPHPVSWLFQPDVGLTAESGNYFLDLSGYNDNDTQIGSISQSIATTIGSTYALSFYIGSDNAYGQPVSIQATAGTTTGTFSSSSTGPDAWDLRTLTFTATTGSTLITLAGGATTPPGYYIGLDNVSVGAVPEPATWAMFLIGFGAMGFAMRRPLRKVVVPFA